MLFCPLILTHKLSVVSSPIPRQISMHCHCPFTSKATASSCCADLSFLNSRYPDIGALQLCELPHDMSGIPMTSQPCNYTQTSNSYWMRVGDLQHLQLSLGLATHILQDLVWGRTKSDLKFHYIFEKLTFYWVVLLSQSLQLILMALAIYRQHSAHYLKFLMNDFLLFSSAITYFS